MIGKLPAAVLEALLVSQNIHELQSLAGEKRLLD